MLGTELNDLKPDDIVRSKLETMSENDEQNIKHALIGDITIMPKIYQKAIGVMGAILTVALGIIGYYMMDERKTNKENHAATTKKIDNLIKIVGDIKTDVASINTLLPTMDKRIEENRQEIKDVSDGKKGDRFTGKDAEDLADYIEKNFVRKDE